MCVGKCIYIYVSVRVYIKSSYFKISYKFPEF